MGLHFPANDIPQSNRQLFVTVRLRMIVDMSAGNVPLLQAPSLPSPIPLSRSTLRGVAGCHKEYCRNMGAQATLVMAVLVTLDPNRPPLLWGLVCCHHHAGPRATSFPLREACDFVIQAFALQLGMESEVAQNEKAKAVLHLQEVLCGMLIMDAPLGLVRRSPNIQDLVPTIPTPLSSSPPSISRPCCLSGACGRGCAGACGEGVDSGSSAVRRTSRRRRRRGERVFGQG